MSGDYSRKRFNPERHYQGVLRQQGRVDLDADWNEYVDIQDRRWRAETIDVVGRCGVPAETPEGFKIGITDGELTVGQGRMYVDGYLTENHGAESHFDVTLEEQYGTKPILVKDQPYGWPVTVPKGVRSLVYLDAWAREVTPLQAPDLVESAVNVDSTTRKQTAWQVRILSQIPAEVNCKTPLAEVPGWPARNISSTVRLTTQPGTVTDQSNPCLVPPTGGYRGLENHLYRIEVHETTVNGVKVKWSRENAHVSTIILEILAGRSIVRIESLGRDDVLRFRTGDWVEFTNDAREFAGLPGEMRKVTLDDSNKTLTFSPALPIGDFPQGIADSTKHLRVIRWDQSGIVRKPAGGGELVNLDLTPDGLIELSTANPGFVLEHGVEATVTIQAGWVAHSGDYWCFAARTAEGDIERLTQAPPLGIHHHYAHLAIIEADGEIHDCRTIFPPLTELMTGCCTVVVRPGEDIQSAIDSLPEAGGCVCLKVGDHEIDAPIRIERSNVSLHGETLGARVVCNKGLEVLRIASSRESVFLEDVKVSGVSFIVTSKETGEKNMPSGIVTIRRVLNVVFDGCMLRSQRWNQAAGIVINECNNVSVTHCLIHTVQYGVVTIVGMTNLTIVGNKFDAGIGRKSDDGVAGMLLRGVMFPAKIEQNRLLGFTLGIVLNDALATGLPFSLAAGSRIVDNYILRGSLQVESSAIRAFAIDVAADDCLIRDNVIVYNSPEYGGISVSGRNSVVEHNQVKSQLKEAGSVRPIGLLMARLGGKKGSLGTIGGRLFGNHLVGVQDGIVIVDNEGADVIDNVIENDEAPVRFGILTVGCKNVTCHGNRVTNATWSIAVRNGTNQTFKDNQLRHGMGGITCSGHTSLTSTGNSIEDMSLWGVITIFGLGRFSFSHNRIMSCGYQATQAIGFGVSQQYGELAVESCEIMNTGVSPDNKTISSRCCSLFADLVLEARVQSNILSYTDASLLKADSEHRALWMRGWLEQTFGVDAGRFQLGFSAQILDNKFVGPGWSALIEIAEHKVTENIFHRFERLFFNNNFCWHTASRGERAATVSLMGRSAVVMGNHIKSKASVPSVDFHNMKDAIYMGNIAQSKPVPDPFGGIPTLVSGFNRP